MVLFIIFGSLSQVLAEDTQLPAKYDLRNLNGKNYVSSVKFQNPWGDCWAFANIASIETSAQLQGAKSNLDLSERALAWFNAKLQKTWGNPDSDYEGIYILNTQGAPQGIGFETYGSLNSGGNQYYTINQYSTWLGGNTSAAAPYQNDENLVDNHGTPTMQGTWSLPYNMLYNDEIRLRNGGVRSSSVSQNADKTIYYNTDPQTFITQMKQDILEHGAVSINIGFNQDRFTGNTYFNSKTNAYYNYEPTPIDHAVCVVGWDDTYPASNFMVKPPGDGALIVKNSWSTDWGDNGYFYLSYYDTAIDDYIWFDAETPDITGGYTYDNNYQYDLLGGKNGSIMSRFIDRAMDAGIQPNTYKFANIFESDHNETLEAVSVYNAAVVQNYQAVVDTNIQVYILNNNYSSPTDGNLVANGSLSVDELGFYTVELDKPVKLTKGTKFSVVETQNASVTVQGQEFQTSLVSFETGLDHPVDQDLIGPDGSKIGTSIQTYQAHANPGESFIYGVGGNTWLDVTSSTVQNDPILSTTTDIPYLGNTIQAKTVIGNAMIKAFTTDDGESKPTPSTPEVDRIDLSPDIIYLSTEPGNTNSVTINATFSPSNAHLDVENLRWGATEGILDIQVDPSNTSATITALQEGYAAVECFNGAHFGTAVVWVTNQPLVAEGIEVEHISPDSFNVAVTDVHPNPAIPSAQNINIDAVSIFLWSETNQGDINAKRVESDGSGDFLLRNVPVNDTAVNNYFLNADNINLNVYANSGNDFYWLDASKVNWVENSLINPQSIRQTKDLMTYITYGQNIGFVQPSVTETTPSGVIGSDTSRHLEGVRISSNVMGMNAITKVYAQGLGWIESQDGSYCGTMGQNRPIEAMTINLEGPYSAEIGGQLMYRAYIDGQGWTNWVINNTQVGNPNSGQPILAIDLRFNEDR